MVVVDCRRRRKGWLKQRDPQAATGLRPLVPSKSSAYISFRAVVIRDGEPLTMSDIAERRPLHTDQ